MLLRNLEIVHTNDRNVFATVEVLEFPIPWWRKATVFRDKYCTRGWMFIDPPIEGYKLSGLVYNRLNCLETAYNARKELNEALHKAG